MRPPAAALLLAFAAALAAGCGYRLQSPPESRFSSPGFVVDLPPFHNRSLFPDGGAFLAARLREEMRRGGFRGGFREEGAAVRIEGTVREVRDDLVSVDAAGFGLQYTLTLIVDVRAVNADLGTPIWREEGLREKTTYYSSGDFQYTEANRRAAFEEACRRAAIRAAQTLRVVL